MSRSKGNKTKLGVRARLRRWAERAVTCGAPPKQKAEHTVAAHGAVAPATHPTREQQLPQVQAEHEHFRRQAAAEAAVARELEAQSDALAADAEQLRACAKAFRANLAPYTMAAAAASLSRTTARSWGSGASLGATAGTTETGGAWQQQQQDGEEGSAAAAEPGAGTTPRAAPAFPHQEHASRASSEDTATPRAPAGPLAWNEGETVGYGRAHSATSSSDGRAGSGGALAAAGSADQQAAQEKLALAEECDRQALECSAAAGAAMAAAYARAKRCAELRALADEARAWADTMSPGGPAQ